MTLEFPAHWCLKRAKADQLALGTPGRCWARRAQTVTAWDPTMPRSDDDTRKQARSVEATATFVAEGKSPVAAVGRRQHSTCPRR
jgi:hypothetical protein